jgi:uncharacterized integral membrane protein
MSEAPRRDRAKAPSGLSWVAILWIVLAAYAVIVLVLNSERVEIDFVFLSARVSKIWLILLSMALGAALALFGPRYVRYRRRRAERRAASSE